MMVVMLLDTDGVLTFKSFAGSRKTRYWSDGEEKVYSR